MSKTSDSAKLAGMVSPAYARDYCRGCPPRSGHAFARLYKAEPFELSYLSWGYRQFGDGPVAPNMHEGWHYFVVLSGTPDLLVADKVIRTKPGMISVAHPDCPIGHSDKPSRRCKMLTWIWRAPPTHSALCPAPGEHFTLMLDKAELKRLSMLHLQCRDAVASSDERCALQLRCARLQTDLLLLESLEHRRVANRSFRMSFAIDYIHNHLADHQPIRSLCEYLNISEATLRRLFHEHAGKSPRDFAQECRMRWARERLLPTERTVKSVAYALGYRHPADFSRAFKRVYRENASGVLSVEPAAAPNDVIRAAGQR